MAKGKETYPTRHLDDAGLVMWSELWRNGFQQPAIANALFEAETRGSADLQLLAELRAHPGFRSALGALRGELNEYSDWLDRLSELELNAVSALKLAIRILEGEEALASAKPAPTEVA